MATDVDWDGLIRDGFDAFARFDTEKLIALCDEDVTIHPMRAAFEDTVYHGHEGVRRFVADSNETWAELLVEPEEIETAGDRALVVGRLVGRSASGLPLDVPLAWILRALDGRLLKIRTYVDRDDARRDFIG